MKTPKLSVVVAVYRMRRAAMRTLISLTPSYQEGVEEDDYEVLVVENPSENRLDRTDVVSHGNNFDYVIASEPNPSPAQILNQAGSRARGEILLLMIDGARLLSPGVLRNVIDASRLHPRPIVAFHGFHLGSELQHVAVPAGTYNEALEDKLLEAMTWPIEGYRLFGASVFAASSGSGWFSPMAESNCLALPKASFLECGGYDERFRSPGGGFLNLEFYERVVRLPDHQLFYVIGEGSFHQVHGGVATNAAKSEIPAFREEYRLLKGHPWSMPSAPEPRFLGSIKLPAVEKLAPSAQRRYHWKQINEPDHVARRLDQLMSRDGQDMAERILARPIIFIHGMHRSGTSALAGGFTELGCEIPPPVIGKSSSNPDGHYESLPIVLLNERILRALGSSWHHTTALPDQWPARPSSAEFIPAIRGVLQEAGALGESAAGNGASNGPLLIKDPRLSRVWPLWQEALRPSPGDVFHLLVLRDPDAVAQSLRRRNSTTHEHALLLWMRYASDFFDAFAGTRFGIVRYEALLGSARTLELGGALDAAGLTLFRSKEIERIVHNFAARNSSRETRATEWCRQLYEQLTGPHTRAEALRNMRERLDAVQKSCGAYLGHLERQHVM